MPPRSRSSSFEAAVADELARDLDVSIDEDLAKEARVVRERCTAAQLELIDDPAKRKALLCPRRTGKTVCDAHLLIIVCLEKRDAECCYITDTLKNARKRFWGPLRKLNKTLSLDVKFNGTEMTATFPNGSVLWVGGAETMDEADNWRGGEPDAVCVDEAQDFRHDILEYLLDDVLEPSLMTRKGILVLTGTPEAAQAGLYFEVTGPAGTQVVAFADGRKSKSRPFRDRKKRAWKAVEWEWSLHRWTLEENTAVPDQWDEAKKIKKRKGWTDDNPIWMREYLGKWAANTTRRVFQYDESRDTWTPVGFTPDGVALLPDGHDWRKLIGIDLGSSDPDAIQVFAFAKTFKSVLQIYEFQKTKLSVTQLAAQIKHAAEITGGMDEVDTMVSDWGALGDKVKDELEQEHGLFIERAAKKNKPDHWELVNAAFIDERLKLLKRSLLAGEMAVLEKDPKNPMKEKSGMPNNNCDAALYLMPYAHGAGTEKPEEELPPAAVRAKQQQDEAAAFLAKQAKAKNRDQLGSEPTWDQTTEWR